MLLTLAAITLFLTPFIGFFGVSSGTFTFSLFYVNVAVASRPSAHVLGLYPYLQVNIL